MASSTLFMAIAIKLTLNFSSYSSVVAQVHENTTSFGRKGLARAQATWYGDETGAGSGGACALEDNVNDPPLASMIEAENANIFLKAKECGHCFQILCNQQPYCSGQPVIVTINDECPGACNNVPFHFDLSGYAFGAMAHPGQEHNLRILGQVDVAYQRVSCNYGGTKNAFKVSERCNPYWFGVALEYADGDGGFKSVGILPGGTWNFVRMDNLWGAVWKRDIGPSFQPPYSFRLTSADGKTIVANNVIPQNFTPGQKY